MFAQISMINWWKFLLNSIAIHGRLINPQEINPQEINPQEINPQEIHPQEIHPQEINPQEINPQEINPQAVMHPGSINWASYWRMHRWGIEASATPLVPSIAPPSSHRPILLTEPGGER